jgi:hypothetical protein
VTFEARLGFLIFFLLVWAVIALVPWAVATVWRRGEGAALALPLAILAAWAAAILMPALGLRDLTGFYLSLIAAAAGSVAGTAAGLAIAHRLSHEDPPRYRFAPGELPRRRAPASIGEAPPHPRPPEPGSLD